MEQLAQHGGLPHNKLEDTSGVSMGREGREGMGEEEVSTHSTRSLHVLCLLAQYLVEQLLPLFVLG